MDKSVIVAARRSPIGKYLGGLARIPAPRLGALVARAVLDDAGVSNDAVDEAWVGCVLQAGLGQNPARQVALGADLHDGITAVTVNKVCGSGLEAVLQADRAIRCGDTQVALAGGIESMSLAPYYVPGIRSGLKFGDGALLDGMQHDGLTCAFEHWAMGCAAEHIAQGSGITRSQQDAFAAASHRKAAQARDQGWFDREIVGIDTGKRRGIVTHDETIRDDVSVDSMSELKPVFATDGTVTAANASALADGAAMTLVASAQVVRRNRWPVRGEILSSATAGVAPKELFSAPVLAIRRVVERAELTLDQIDLLELNEAFAAQSLSNLKALEFPESKVNVHGGAIALGHPIGASGARILVTLLHAMERRNLRHGVACLCLGGGNAVALCIRRPPAA